MQCPRCQHEEPDGSLECARCGVVFAKLGAPRRAPPPDAEPTKREILKEILLPARGPTTPVFLGARAVLLAVLALWGGSLVLTPVGSTEAPSVLVHLVNLPFHEAGHVLFSPFGHWVMSLGGSLGQVLMPLVCLVALLFQTRDAFGAAVCTWWMGESFLDMAPYINDARSLTLPLLGGNTGEDAPYGFHDWQYILTEVGLVQYDHAIAWAAHVTGSLLMVLGVVWGAVVLRGLGRRGG